MYISSTIILLISICGIIYWYYKTSSNKEEFNKVANHFTSKYERTINACYAFRKTTLDYSKIVSDMIDIRILQELANEDSVKYNEILKGSQGDNKGFYSNLLEEWIEQSEVKYLVNIRNFKNKHHIILNKLATLEQLQAEFANHYVITKNGTLYQRSVEDMMDAFIYTNDFYETINKERYLPNNLDKAINASEELMTKLNEIEISLKDRHYNIN